MKGLLELQEQLRRRSYERRMFVEQNEALDEEFNKIKSRFTRGKYDTVIDLIKW